MVAGTINLAPGIAVVVGKNDIGKTALLEMPGLPGDRVPVLCRCLRQHLRDYFAVNVGKAEVPAHVAISEARVVESKAVENGGL